jgi:hypothetical protein
MQGRRRGRKKSVLQKKCFKKFLDSVLLLAPKAIFNYILVDEISKKGFLIFSR